MTCALVRFRILADVDRWRHRFPDAGCATCVRCPCAQTDLVGFEKMTWVEVKCEIAAGKTTALIYTGGVEERGPRDTFSFSHIIRVSQPCLRTKARMSVVGSRLWRETSALTVSSTIQSGQLEFIVSRLALRGLRVARM